MHHMFTYKENVFKELFLDKLGMFDLPIQELPKSQSIKSFVIFQGFNVSSPQFQEVRKQYLYHQPLL